MRRDLKWYCAINAETLDCDGYEWRDLIRVGITSALRNTHLRPHLIYDGPEDDFLGEIRQLGATVIRQKTSLYTALHERYHDRPQWLAAVSGAFLRFEIPQIEMTDQFVLYTDSDVLFLRDPQFGDTDPAIFGATSQFSHNPAEDMNSGVMLINVPGLRAQMPALKEFTCRSLDLGLDQEMLRAFFGDNYTALSRTLNWKPYWGWNPEAEIVHFHGPKPVAIRNFLAEGLLPSDPNWAFLLQSDRTGLEAYTRLWYFYHERVVPEFATAKSQTVSSRARALTLDQDTD